MYRETPKVTSPQITNNELLFSIFWLVVGIFDIFITNTNKGHYPIKKSFTIKFSLGSLADLKVLIKKCIFHALEMSDSNILKLYFLLKFSSISWSFLNFFPSIEFVDGCFCVV